MKTIVQRPGVTLLLTGIVAFFARRVVGWVPFIGGTMKFVLLVFAFFAIVGGFWILLNGRRHSDA